MSRIAVISLGITSAALAALLAGEFGGAGTVDASRTVIMPPLAVVGPPVGEVDHIKAWVAHILARPLFDPNRRPPAETLAATPADGLPRLTGVLVGPFGRQAIFALSGDEHPIIVTEGSRLGIFSVQAISAGQVLVQGPAGTRLLHPAFDTASVVRHPSGLPGFPALRGTPMPAAGLPDLPGHAKLAEPVAAPALLATSAAETAPTGSTQ